MIKKLCGVCLLFGLLMTSVVQAAPTVFPLVYVTDLGIFASDSTGVPPKTILGWVSVVGRTTCAAVSMSPRGRYIATIHPATNLQFGYALDLLKVPETDIVKRVAKQVVDPKLKPDLDDVICNNSPVWSPDGTHIAFRAQYETAQPAVYDFNITALRSRRLALAQAGLAPEQIFWSPSSDWIVFSDHNPGSNESLYLVPFDASKDPQLIYTGTGQFKQIAWTGDNEFVSWHDQPSGGADCLTNFRVSQIPARSSRVLFTGCASATLFDPVHRVWLLNVTVSKTPKGIASPGLYLLSTTGAVARIDSLSGDPVRFEPGDNGFIVHAGGSTYTIDPLTAAAKPYLLPGNVPFPADAILYPGKGETVFSTADGIWAVDPKGSAAPLINDPPGDSPLFVWAPDSATFLAVRKSGVWVYQPGSTARLVYPGKIAWAGWGSGS
jgi:hypothetical protein